MTTQPEALRLANSLAAHSLSRHGQTQAAAELRRLHAENASLSAALAASCDEARDQLWESGGVAGCSRALSAEFQRDALLEALKLALSSHGVMLMSDPPQDAWKVNRVEERGCAAIKAVEETK